MAFPPAAVKAKEKMVEEMSESESEEEESTEESEEEEEDPSPAKPKKKGDAPNPLMQWAQAYKGK